MYRYIPFLSLLFFSCICKAQNEKINIRTVNHIFKTDSHGDSIRKYLNSTYYRQGPKGLLIAAYYSNKLQVSADEVENQAPKIKEYTNRPNGTYEVSADSYAGQYAIPILDTSGVIVTVNGINPENAHQYEFRVLENKTEEIVGWSTPALFVPIYMMSRIADPAKEDKVSAYLGQFKAKQGNALTIQIRERANPAVITASLSAYWLTWKPRVVGIFTFSELPDFLTVFHNQWGNQILGNSYNRNWRAKTRLLRIKHAFNHDDNNLIFYLDDIIGSKNITQFNLLSDKDSTGWKGNNFDFNLVWLKNLSPGNYTLKLRYSLQPEQITSYKFSINAAWYQTIWAKLGLSVLFLSTIGFIVLIWQSRKQSQRLKAQLSSKQMVQTELKSIRSQFNPHFVFNALSSIQGLITKNDSENASKYLREFSTLMRESLRASNHEFVSILTETKILENYLKLEQLRFGFLYHIAIDPALDINAIEIPSLFLQPMVENAVKHGVSTLQEAGILHISFKEVNNDMIVCVKDNGKGFISNTNSTGFGLQLSKERINLLNQTLNNQQISLSITRADDETQVSIQFKNWLL